jgi:hypothetical protein
LLTAAIPPVTIAFACDVDRRHPVEQLPTVSGDHVRILVGDVLVLFGISAIPSASLPLKISPWDRRLPRRLSIGLCTNHNSDIREAGDIVTMAPGTTNDGSDRRRRDSTTVDRRTLLAGTGSAATAVSGCLGTLSGDDGPQPAADTTVSSVTERADSDRPPARVRAYQTADGTAYAEGRDVTYEGADVLAVIQRAIDAKLAADIGFIHIGIEPDIYPVSNTLSVTAKGPTAISIESPSASGAYLQTRGGPDGEGIPDGETVLAFDPDAGSSVADRAWGIELRGITIDDRRGIDDGHGYSRAHPYTAGSAGSSEPRLDGLFINDCRDAIVERFVAHQFRTALRLENVWQGKLDFLAVGESGHQPSNSPAIQVIGGDDEFASTEYDDTANANNHLQFNHLQGNARAYRFFECRRARNTQCEINFANVELQQSNAADAAGIEASSVGFVFRGRGNKWLINDSFFKHGRPSIDARGGSKLVIDGCYQEGGGQFLHVDDAARVVLGDCMIEGDETDAISVTNCRLTASNLWVYWGHRGLHVQAPQETNVSNCTFVAQSDSAIRITNPGGQQILTDILARRVGTGGSGYAIDITNPDTDVLLGHILAANADSNRDDGAISAPGGSSNVHLGLVVPSANVTRELVTE